MNLISVCLLAAALYGCTPSGDAHVPKQVSELNAKQQRSLQDYIRQYERPTGDLKILANRRRLQIRTSKTLQQVFPRYSFVVVPWEYRAEPGNPRGFSIPGGLYSVVALRDDGDRFVFYSTGNRQEYAEFLRLRRIRFNEETAVQLWAAHHDLYGMSEGAPPKRYGNSEWRFGYQESVNVVSESEEERVAYYYQLHVDASDMVIDGRFVAETLERRKKGKPVDRVN